MQDNSPGRQSLGKESPERTNEMANGSDHFSRPPLEDFIMYFQLFVPGLPSRAIFGSPCREKKGLYVKLSY